MNLCKTNGCASPLDPQQARAFQQVTGTTAPSITKTAVPAEPERTDAAAVAINEASPAAGDLASSLVGTARALADDLDRMAQALLAVSITARFDAAANASQVQRVAGMMRTQVTALVAAPTAQNMAEAARLVKSGQNIVRAAADLTSGARNPLASAREVFKATASSYVTLGAKLGFIARNLASGAGNAAGKVLGFQLGTAGLLAIAAGLWFFAKRR